MKKIISSLILLIFLILVLLIITLSTIGIETDKFNKIISDKASQTKNISLKLDLIKFKIDLKNFSLFLETQNPIISYSEISIPAKNVKVYFDFISILKSNPIIKKANIALEELDVDQLNKLSIFIKPSNFKSLLNNRIKEGKLISEIEIFFNERSLLESFIVKGTVKNLKAEINKDFNLIKTNFSFFADQDDILIKNIFGSIEDFKISDGDVKLNLENGLKLNSNFNSKIYFDEKNKSKYSFFLNKLIMLEGVKELKADLNHNIFINLDNTYKIKDYNYSNSGTLEKSTFELKNSIKNNFIKKEIKDVFLSNLKIQSGFSSKNSFINGEGSYSFDNSKFSKFNFKNVLKKNLSNLKLNFDYPGKLELEFVNYKKSKNSTANISLDLEKRKDHINIIKLIFNEKNNKIEIDELKFKKSRFLSFKKINVITSNNEFQILNDKKIVIKGTRFDATNLSKYFNRQSGENKFKKINSNIEIDFKNIKIPMSEKIENFKLLGEIEKGKFVKIISKGDFGGENFLDISMKKDKNSNKKYLEVYSDLTRPLLTEYSFFKGLSGGKLLFSSIIDGSVTISKLKIENFKVINAPGVIKLLSLADLGGLADLAKGEGLTFNLLEIDMEKKKDFLKINEIIALGPSMSVLMEGYQDPNGLTSLRGTLVPAKTLNKIISKIPVIGDIVIPKEAGEGLFGVSFKMKGPKGKIKTSINPIRTLTPRFIQKIYDRKKETK